MKKLNKLRNKLINGLFFFFKSIPSYLFYVTRHYWKTRLVTKEGLSEIKEISPETVQLRLKQCKKCPLFINGKCSSKHFSDGVTLIEIDRVAEENWLSIEEVHLPLKTIRKPKTAEINGNVFVRGCGCDISKKSKIWFSEKELNEPDGFAPCPRNRWTHHNLTQ